MSVKKRGRKLNIYVGQQAVIDKHGLKIERLKLEPHCNCEGSYNFMNKPVTVAIRYGQGLPQITKISDDNETCNFCGHYVFWKEECNYGKKTKNKTK